MKNSDKNKKKYTKKKRKEDAGKFNSRWRTYV